MRTPTNWARRFFQRQKSRSGTGPATVRQSLLIECLENRVTPSGSPPTAAAISRQVVNEDAATVTLNLGTFFTDPENDALTYSVVQTNTAGLVTPTVSGANLTLAFGPNLFGYSYVRVTANDGTGSGVVSFACSLDGAGFSASASSMKGLSGRR